jgi:hypothetical protein
LGKPLGLGWYARRRWGAGEFVGALGEDFWDETGSVKKNTLEDLIVKRELGAYRELPGFILELLDETFD